MGQRVIIDGTDFLVELSQDNLASGTINGEPFEIDVEWLSDRKLHIIRNSRSYNIELLEETDGKQQIKINGITYCADVVDRFSDLLKKMGIQNGSASRVNDVKAPMPGLVLEIVVGPGDTVSKGDRLFVLEAMKMENVIKSPAGGVVASIETEKGKTVDKNEIMLKFEKS